MSDDAQPPVPRPRVLAWLLVAVVPAFAFTGFITRQYRAHERVLASEWVARADAARREHDAGSAVVALRNALRFSPDRSDYRFALAQALVEAGHPHEARAYLLSLWEGEPGNGPVNLELGRLAVAAANRRDAIRYYHNAVEGSWHDAPEEHRHQARVELARFLIDQGDPAQAQAELIPILDDLPERPAETAHLGRLLMEAGALSRARDAFDAGLSRAPRDPELLAGAGHAAFAAGQYAAARSYLARARSAGAPESAVGRELTLASEVQAIDPFQHRLPRAARARRARAAFDRATARLASCPETRTHDGGDLASLATERAILAPRVTLRNMQQDADLLEAAVELAFRIEHATQSGCGEVEPRDIALLLVERLHAGER